VWVEEVLRGGVIEMSRIPSVANHSSGSSAVKAAAGILIFMIIVAASAPGIAADPVGVIDLQKVAKAHFFFLNGAEESDPRVPPPGPDPKAVEAQQARLKALRERLARERLTLSQEEKESLQREIREGTVALQQLYSKTSKDTYDRLRWRSPEIFFPHLKERIHEYGRERGLAMIVDRAKGTLLYLPPDGRRDDSGERVDLTESLTEWLRNKDSSLFDGTSTSSAQEGQ
jgi:hypothetical protein